MSRLLPHFYLNNPTGLVHNFDKSRAINDPKIEPKDPEAYRKQKQKLRTSFTRLLEDREVRLRQRSLNLSIIEIVEIRFLIPFSDGAKYKTRTRFYNEFGLSSVSQKDFNRTVLFAIVDQDKFIQFNDLLNQYIESDNHISPQRQNYAIMTTLFDVKYHTADDIRNHCSGDLIFEFINNNQYVHREYKNQFEALQSYLNDLLSSESINFFSVDPYHKMIQLKGADRDVVLQLAQNFDILAKAHSLRTKIIKPDRYNVSQLTWDLRIRNNEHNQTLVGILDNGIRPIEPIQEVVIDGHDITATDPLQAAHPHGTVVASLAAVGDRFFSTQSELVADTQIYSIKILEDLEGYIDVIEVVNAIRYVHHTAGVRLFNLSVCCMSKSYNEPPSLFAYLLDKLAYEEDILIFIAAGNMNYDDIVAMAADSHHLHQYPHHFYNPDESSEIHSCEFTNISTPAESMNHISVGALADNYRSDSQTDLSHDRNLPAYYSRKNHYDFKREINGAILSNNHSNKNLFKPDIVMPGGDLLDTDSGMQVLGFGDLGTDYYSFDAGTSLAAPLALNLAVQILNIYPQLSLQSVKALMLNSADSFSHQYLEKIVQEWKDKLSNELHGKNFDNLQRGEKTNISKQFLSEEDIHRNLVGLGKPDKEKLLYSTDSEVSLLIDDVIQTDHHKVILINIPDYLLQNTKSRCLEIHATLCFKINPAWGNHVDYNPLHISFNFLNGVVDSLDDLADIISNRNHDYFKRFWTDDVTELESKKNREGLSEDENKELLKKKSTIKDQALGVKKTPLPWSEDFFPLVNKPLSNRQKMRILLNKEEIVKIDGKLAIAFRCAVKENLEPDLQVWEQQTPEHAFSLAIRIEDTTKIKGNSLYDELQAINTLEVINNTLVDLDQDLEAEA